MARLGRTVGCLTAALAGVAVFPCAASAHGLVSRADLPIPPYVFAWVAAAVLVLSFVLLTRLWQEPRLIDPHARRLVTLPPGWDIAWGALGLAVFAIVVVSGLAGGQGAGANLASTVIFVAFWVGLPIASVLLGNVFAALNPWRTLARLFAAGARRAGIGTPAPLPYPERLGYWPAAAGVVAYGWVELVLVGRDRPSTLALLALAYAGAQLAGMARYGIEPWTERGDAFAVVFALFARLSVIRRRGRVVELRRPLTGLSALVAEPGAVALLSAMIGVTAFDGASNGALWREPSKPLEQLVRHAGLGGTATDELVRTGGLLVSVAAIYGLYMLGARGMRAVESGSTRDLAAAFAWSLVPIAFGYLLAHYFSLLVFQGQSLAAVISDPLGDGANLFGTAGTRIDYGLVSAAAIWYVQVAALLAGHVGGVLVAHDRAIATFGPGERSRRSQTSMLVVMVFLTCMGLFLLSAVGT